MAMDVLRSGCKAWVEVGTDPGTKARIRWYRCRPGAKAFPGWHAFGSTQWEPNPDEWTEGPGMYADPIKWAPSIIPCPPGQEYHGLPEWYEDGLPGYVLADPGQYSHPPCPGYAADHDIRGRGRAGKKKPPKPPAYGIHGRGRLDQGGDDDVPAYGIHGRGRLDQGGDDDVISHDIHGRGRVDPFKEAE